MSQKLKLIGLLLLPLLLYVVGLIAYFSDTINSFVFLPLIMVGLTLSIIFVILFKKQQNIFLAIAILLVILFLFELRLVSYEANTYIAMSYMEPIEVVEKSGIYVMAVSTTNVPYIEDPKYMIESLEYTQHREVLEYESVTNRIRYFSKNNELLGYIGFKTNDFNDMKSNVNAYLQSDSPSIKNFFNREDLEGDSAGLALALSGLYEKGQLENTLSLAVTGAIDNKGNVSAIGSVISKILIAEKNNMPYIILPIGNEVEAQKVKLEKKLKIEIIAVEHIDEAVKEIEKINVSNYATIKLI
ncbi:S16 family serine protease [Solibacillus sp. FSL K6-1523]|uniref:S16 family serine protease n=1 Tax=Solibacillus sp. FSL K6-1523 TaxID=2921471 RepID=UPI0030FBAB9F